MTTTKQDQEFKKIVGDELPNSLLQTAIDWIRDNLTPADVFGLDGVIKFIKENENCENVFDEKELEKWSLENGYRKSSKHPTGTLEELPVIH